MNFKKQVAMVLAAASVAGLLGPMTARAETLKAVMNSDLKILDPIWTTAYVQRGFGYMVWDTLFALDEKLQVQPEMVDKWEVSPDKLTWTFTLREGLVWSDGAPVTAEDCIQSIKRWGARDSMGQKMLASVAGFEAVDARTFRMKMKEPYGLVLESLGKPSANVPFMMPKRVAETDPFTQIKAEDVIGSGPFVFIAKEWKPGEKVVFVKNPTYKPRAEPPSGLAGAKIAKFDRIEWIWIPDAQTQVAALQSGEVDMLEQPSPDLLPLMAKDKNIRLFDANPLGNQYALRFNTLFKPFDNPKIRHAAMVAFNQEDFLKATIGDPKYYKVCKAVFVCGSVAGQRRGHGRGAERQRRQGQAASAGGGLRRHAGRAPAVDRPHGADQHGAGRQGAARGRRLQGQHPVDGLADAGLAPHQEGSAGQGRLERLHHLVGGGRYPEPGECGLLQCVVRQGPVRLAVRRDDREDARSVRQGIRSRQAEADRHRPAEILGRPSDPCPSRPVVPADCAARRYRRHDGGAGDGVLEHEPEEVDRAGRDLGLYQGTMPLLSE